MKPLTQLKNDIREACIAANKEIENLQFGGTLLLFGKKYKVVSIAGDEKEWTEMIVVNQRYKDVLGVATIITKKHGNYI